MSPRFSHVIFDLDGTLLDSEPAYQRAGELVCNRYGATFSLELKRAIMGGDTMSGAQFVVDALKLPLSADAYLAERERELELLFPSVEPMPFAVRLVSALRARGVPIAVATSGHASITEAKLAHQPFLRALSVRVCGDDPRLRRGKPAPDIFLLAARDLGAAPERCIVVEDSALGMQAALAAEMHTVALVDRRYFSDETFLAASQLIHSLDELDLDALGLIGRAPS